MGLGLWCEHNTLLGQLINSCMPHRIGPNPSPDRLTLPSESGVEKCQFAHFSGGCPGSTALWQASQPLGTHVMAVPSTRTASGDPKRPDLPHQAPKVVLLHTRAT